MRNNGKLIIISAMIAIVMICEIALCTCGTFIIAMLISIATTIAGVAVFITHLYGESTVVAASFACHAVTFIMSWLAYIAEPDIAMILVVGLGTFSMVVQAGLTVACAQGRL